jgi:hypothetical protein
MNVAARSTVIALIFCTSAVAQVKEPASRGGDIAQAFDRKLETITLTGETVPEVLAELGKLSGVPLKMDDETAELLPWGCRTKLADVTIKNASLREALPQILAQLGMTYEQRDDHIAVVPTKPLARINRRATWDDLALLRWCDTTEYTSENFAKANVQYRITSKVDAPKMLQRQLARAGQGSVAQMLEVACGSLGWVWLPNEDHIVVRTYEAQVANQLSRSINARYVNMPLSRILNDLASKADVALFLEPGMMLELPRSTSQSYTLLLEQRTVRQAFELLAAETGLQYRISRDGIFVGLSAAIEGGGRRTGSQSPYVGKISIPSPDGSYTLDFLLRGDELPPDILEYREQLLQEYFEKMRKDLQLMAEQSMEREAAAAAIGAD